MRRFQYTEPGHNDEPITITVSESWIMAKYKPYWLGAMDQAGRDWRDFTDNDIIDDFQIVNWAEEI